MGLISEYLKKIKEAVYGEEVRDSIHDAIEQCYKDATGHPDSVAATVGEINKISSNLDGEIADRKSDVDTERKRIDNLVKDTTDNVVEYKADNFLMSCKSDAQASTTETALNVFKNISSKSENLGNFITISSGSKTQIKKSGLYSFDCKVQVTGVNASVGRQYARLKINDVQKNEYMISLVGETDEEFTNFIVSLNEGDTISFTGEADHNDTWITLYTTIHILDYDGKVKIPDITKEVSDIRVGEDGTVYGTAGEAVRKQIGNLKEDLVEISKLEKPEIEFTITGYFANNGYHSSNEYFKSTDFVELVKDGIYIPLRYHLKGSNLQEILIYNKEKRVIKTIPLSPSSDYQVLDGVLEFEKDFYYAKFCSYSVNFDYWVKFDTIRNQIPYESLRDGMIPRHEISMEKLTGMIHDPSTNFINLLDVNKGYVNNDGEFVEDDTWHNTGLIRLISGEKYYWSGFYHKYYAFYDKNFKIVSKSTDSLSNPFIVPANATYGLFSMDGDFSGCWIHNINKKPADYAECLNIKNIYALGKKQGVENAGKVLSVNNEGNVVPVQLKKESGASTKIYKKGNLLKFDEIESGYIKADGTVQPYSTLWCTGFCEVEQGKVYVKGFLLSQYFAFYDGSKKVVKTYEEGAMQQYTPQIYCIDVPANAKYFRCTANEDPRVATNNLFFVSNKAELPEEGDKLSFDGTFPYNVSPSNPCDYAELTVGVFNKCVFIGNSLTYGTFNMDDGASYGSVTSPQELADKYSYPSQFKKITGIDIINLGVAGATSVSWYNSHSDYNYSGCDMAIIHLGVNDAAFKVSDTDTKAALVNIINSLKLSVKNIKIFLCTIIPAYSNVEQTGYRQKSEVIRELYNEKYKEDINVVLLDLEKYGHTKAYTSYTSGHLSALGYYVLARDIARYISWHIDNNLRDYRFIQFIGNDGLYTGD